LRNWQRNSEDRNIAAFFGGDENTTKYFAEILDRGDGWVQELPLRFRDSTKGMKSGWVASHLLAFGPDRFGLYSVKMFDGVGGTFAYPSAPGYLITQKQPEAVPTVDV
jgi:hypothetical protein